MPCSTTAVQEAVNFKVTGSNPVGAVVIHNDMTKPNKEDILDLLEKNVYDYHVLPHHGLIPDWYERYWQLHMMLKTYFENHER